MQKDELIKRLEKIQSEIESDLYTREALGDLIKELREPSEHECYTLEDIDEHCEECGKAINN